MSFQTCTRLITVWYSLNLTTQSGTYLQLVFILCTRATILIIYNNKAQVM